MKTIRSVHVELHKIVTSLPFYLCIAVTVFLCLASGLCENESHHGYSILSAILTLSRDAKLTMYGCNWHHAILNGAGSWLILLIPIVAAIPFIPDFVDERTSGNMRMTIERMGEKRYYVVKFVSCFIGGAMAVVIGYILFCGISVLGLPSPFEGESLGSPITKHEVIATTLKSMLGMFFYGGLWSMAAFLMAGIVKNKYLVLCVPFACKYVYDQYMMKNYFDLQWAKSDAMTSLANSNFPIGKMLLLSGVMFLLCFFAFSFIMHKRRDLGA